MTARLMPSQMADIYFYRMHFSSLGAVSNIIGSHAGSESTCKYWREVLRILNEKAKATKGVH